MIEINFNKSMMKEAQDWANNLGSIKNSITKGKGNYAGRLGELALAKHLNVDRLEDNRSYDIIFNEKKIEVKTKRRAVKPKDSYVVNVAKTSNHQNPDYYAFVSLEYADRDSGGNYYDLQHIWLCGYKSHKDFIEKSEFWPKGFPDPKMPSWKSHVDMHVMEIANLDDGLY
jgi:hypothetical protein